MIPARIWCPWDFINIVARMNTTAIDTYDWDLRPHLRALVWDDGEADDIVFQAHPAYLAQGRERGS